MSQDNSIIKSTYTDYALSLIEKIFKIGQDETGHCTALTYSHRLAKRTLFVEKEMQTLGITVNHDMVGNMIGLFPGTHHNKKIMITSHLDTVVNAGKHDGVLGIVTGLTAIKYFVDHNIKPHFDIEIRVCMGEESPGLTATFGSKFSVGDYTLNELERMLLPWDPTVTVKEAINRYFLSYLRQTPPTFNQHQYEKSQISSQEYRGAIEIHTEQFYKLKRLSNNGQSPPWIGVMTGVGGHIRLQISTKLTYTKLPNHESGDHYKLTFLGKAAHTGAVPMKDPERDDALVTCCTHLKVLQKKGVFIGYPQIATPSLTTIPSKVTVSVQTAHPDKLLPYLKKNTIQWKQINSKFTPTNQQTITDIIDLVLMISKVDETFNQDETLRGVVSVLSLNQSDTNLTLLIDLRGMDYFVMENVVKKIHTLPLLSYSDSTIISKKEPIIFPKKLYKKVSTLLAKVFENRVMKNEPSIPGQDIGNFAKINIPSVLLFVESNSGHHPNEHVRSRALHQSIEALIEVIGLFEKEALNEN